MGGRGGGRALALALLVLAGCRGPASSPLDPSPGRRTIQLLSGDDGAPVSGASVRIGERSTVTDAQGRLVVELGDAQALDAEALGFLPRQTSLGSADRFTLWPVPSYPEEYVRRLLYTSAGAPSADQPLRRVVAASVSVVLSDELARDEAAADAHRRAAGLLTEATAGAVRFQVDAAPRGNVVFRISREGGAEGALTHRQLRGDVIVGGHITYSHLRYARDLRFVAHELGHALGLQHSLDPDDMMHFSCGSGCAEAFSGRERLTIRLLLQRRPGNHYPDNDRGAAAASAPGLSVVVD